MNDHYLCDRSIINTQFSQSLNIMNNHISWHIFSTFKMLKAEFIFNEDYKVSIEVKSLVRVENIRFELKILNSNLNEFEIFNRIRILNWNCWLIKMKFFSKKKFNWFGAA
jgi:hypothetical protein